MPADPRRVKELFAAALDLAFADRDAFLDRECGPDAELRHRVGVLLRAHDDPESALERPLAAPADPETAPYQPEHATESVGTVVAGRYKLLERIGEGGMGEVWVADQLEPIRRRVALKLIKPGMDSRAVLARFEAERQALALMDHPNIAKVLDAGTTDDGRPFFVMELVKGTPITQFCDERKLTTRERLELFLPVCQAIQHAHQKGIIHRDVKPSNVLVALHDEKAVPKVIDFGVAKAVGQQLTEKTLYTGFGALVGTPAYMAPEQATFNQLDIDTRADVYALGVLLYELLAGSTPFEPERLKRAALDEVLRLVREEEPQRPSARLSTSEGRASIAAVRQSEPGRLTKLLRGELDSVVMKAMEKDRNRRYETANGFAADVQRYLAGEAVQAVPPSAGYRLRKFARRNRRAVLTATVLAVATLIAAAAVGGSVGWASRDRAARQAAVEQEANLALNEAERWQEQGKWPEALSAARRAEGLLAGGGSDELRERARQLRKDLEMVLRLEEIPLLAGAALKNNEYDSDAVDRAYAQAFEEYGIDIARRPAEEAAAKIRARPGVAVALTTALDTWAISRAVKDRAGAAALTAAAQAADTDPWRRQVRVALEHRDGKALAALATSPELSRQSPPSLMLLSRALRTVGLKAARIEVLRRAQRQYPGDFWINMGLASALSQMGASYRDEVVSFCRAALAVRPQSGAAHSELGFALQSQGKLDEAVACFRKLVELDPGSALAHSNLGFVLRQLGKLDEAIDCYRKALELDTKQPKAHYNLGFALQDQGKLDEAVACFRTAVELDPQSAHPLTALGFALRTQKKFPEAVVAYQRAVQLDPKQAVAYSNLALALVELDDPLKLPEAVAAAGKAIEIDPKSADAYNVLGLALDDQKTRDQAITAFRKAIDFDPKHPHAHSNLATALAQQGKYDQAIVCCRKALEINPKNIGAYVTLGIALRRQGNLDDAIAALHKAHELDPKNAHAQASLGAAHYSLAWELTVCSDLKLRDPKRALVSARLATQLDPKNGMYWQGLGYAEYRSGNWKAAVRAFEKVKELGSAGDSMEWFPLSMAYWQLGDKDAARKTYDQAVEWMEKNNPNDGFLLGLQAEAAKLMGIALKKE